MNLKVTAGLLIVAAIVFVVFLINPFEKEEEAVSRSPWFYQVSEDDIETITVSNNRGDSVSFDKVADFTWAFQNPEGIPPDNVRWGGITLLLSGPGTRRDLTAVQPIIDNPAQYGLDDPHTIVDVGLTAGRQIQFRLGDQTTDGRNVYGQVLGFPDLFIIAGIWGEVISRLAAEPPLPKWAVDRTPENFAELNVYLGNAAERSALATLYFTAHGLSLITRHGVECEHHGILLLMRGVQTQMIMVSQRRATDRSQV